jgi:hypothetical protein
MVKGLKCKLFDIRKTCAYLYLDNHLQENYLESYIKFRYKFKY